MATKTSSTKSLHPNKSVTKMEENIGKVQEVKGNSTTLKIEKIYSLSEVKTDEKPEPELSLNYLREQLRNIELPDTNWAFHIVKNDNIELIVFSCLICSYEDIPVLSKKVFNDEQLNVTVFFRQQKMCLETLGISVPVLKSLKSVEEFLRSIHKFKICAGGPSDKFVAKSGVSIAHIACKNELQIWHHKKCCAYVKHHELSCKTCLNLHSYIAKKMKNKNQPQLFVHATREDKAHVRMIEKKLKLQKLANLRMHKRVRMLELKLELNTDSAD